MNEMDQSTTQSTVAANQQWTNVVTTGVFYYRVPYTAQFFFCPIGPTGVPLEKEGFALMCQFEPILEVVEYTIEHSPCDGKYRASVRSVLKVERSPWSKRIVNAIGLKSSLYKEGCTFTELLAKAGGLSRLTEPSPLCKLWMYWERIQYIRTVQQVHLMDTPGILRIASVVHRAFSKQDPSESVKDILQGLACQDTARVYSDLLIGVSMECYFAFTLMQEMKDYMRRMERWEVPLEELKGLPFRMCQFMAKVDPDKYPIQWNSKTSVLSFKPNPLFPDPVKLKPFELVDSYVDRRIKWEAAPLDPDKKNKRVEFVLLGNLPAAARKTHPRVKIQFMKGGACDVWNQTSDFIAECKAERVLFVFDGGFRQVNRARFESWLGQGSAHQPELPRAMIKRSGEGKRIQWVRKLHNNTYKSKNSIYRDDELWAVYRSVQTLSTDEIGLIAESQADMVFFMGGNKATRQRVLDWCDSCCGKDIRLVMVGEISLVH